MSLGVISIGSSRHILPSWWLLTKNLVASSLRLSKLSRIGALRKFFILAIDNILAPSLFPNSLRPAQYFGQFCLSILAFLIQFNLACNGDICFSSWRDFFLASATRHFPFFAERLILPQILAAITRSGLVDLSYLRSKSGEIGCSTDDSCCSKNCQMLSRYFVFIMEMGFVPSCN